jgi:hypothetical protein
MSRFVLQMYYGLHFQFRRALVTREILYIHIHIYQFVVHIFKTVDAVNICHKNEHASDINHI